MPTDQQLANALRVLSMDAVEQARSGHPGMPLGMADIAECLWREVLNHDPLNPDFINRDRFVLSNGHGSMLLYSLLHLSGYDLSIEDIKQFRQLHAKTAGHPEYDMCPGVETTTGPLGQGIANAVGMAIAERALSAEFNTADIELIDHHTYTFLGDGCLMEGISHESASFAGTLKLGKLIAFYDDNGISIDGDVSGWFSDDTNKRFESYDWQVIGPIDGHDREQILQAITTAKAETNKPSLIICKTHIGFGSPNLQDSAKSHGAPFGAEEIRQTRETLGWTEAAFDIPSDIKAAWDQTEKGQRLSLEWQATFRQYQEKFPEKARELIRRLKGELPENFIQECNTLLTKLLSDKPTAATRKSSELVLNTLSPIMPELLGGSADLSGSNNTKVKDAVPLSHNNLNGRYLHYGVREFGMAAIMNGIRLHGGFIPFAGTFLVFSDYAKNAIRLSAMMQQKVIYVLSHDSIGLGEDGPTHQPIEHITSLRTIPGLAVHRPADAYETAISWQQALETEGPSALLLSRQNLPFVTNDDVDAENVKKGGYILRDNGDSPELILLATGSEVELAVEAYDALKDAHAVRVVSMPCMDTFLTQSAEYQAEVLPPEVRKRIAIEAGSPDTWYRFTGLDGIVMGINEFGHSAPYKAVFKALNITTDTLIEKAKQLLQAQ